MCMSVIARSMHEMHVQGRSPRGDIARNADGDLSSSHLMLYHVCYAVVFAVGVLGSQRNLSEARLRVRLHLCNTENT